MSDMMLDWLLASFHHICVFSLFVILDRSWLEATLAGLGLGIVKAHAPIVRGFQWALHIKPLVSGEAVVTLPEDEGPFGRIAPPAGGADPANIGA